MCGEVELTKEQRNLYNQMSKLALAQLSDGTLVSTNNVLTQIMRLQQICCGFIKNDEEEVQEVPSNRLHELVNVCEETDGKSLFGPHTFTISRRFVKCSQKSTGPTALARSMVQHHRKSGSYR